MIPIVVLQQCQSLRLYVRLSAQFELPLAKLYHMGDMLLGYHLLIGTEQRNRIENEMLPEAERVSW